VAELDDRDLAVLAGAGFRIEQPDMAK